MKYRWISAVAAVIAVLGLQQVHAGTFDRPAAVVGRKIILESELQAQMQLFALQNRIDLSNPARRGELRGNLLQQMINDRLILTEAEKDTTISVEPEEIDDALSEHLENLRAQFASEEAFEDELQREGLTYGDLRRRSRQQIGNQLLEQKLISSKLGMVSVTNGEVKEFFARYVDSLPPIPSSVELAHLLTPITIDTNRILATREKLTRIHAEIEAGADFAEAARTNSDDPTAQYGGELGWFGPGDLVPEFEAAARKLRPGQLSGVVRTPFGFHLIEVLEKQGARFRARHILLRLVPDHADTVAAMQFSDSLLQEIRNGADFCLLVRDHTADKQSQKNCGELGPYPIEQMYPEFQEALDGVEIGEYAGPALSEFGVHILHVLDRQEGRPYSLEDDWDNIKQMARREKTNRVVSEWIAQVRQDTYIEIKEY